jgi:hypothetical protein
MQSYVITKCNSFEHLKILLEDGAISAETCRRKGHNICIFIVHVHFVVLKTIFEQMHGMESFKISGAMKCGAR